MKTTAGSIVSKVNYDNAVFLEVCCRLAHTSVNLHFILDVLGEIEDFLAFSGELEVNINLRSICHFNMVQQAIQHITVNRGYIAKFLKESNKLVILPAGLFDLHKVILQFCNLFLLLRYFCIIPCFAQARRRFICQNFLLQITGNSSYYTVCAAADHSA